MPARNGLAEGILRCNVQCCVVILFTLALPFEMDNAHGTLVSELPFSIFFCSAVRLKV